MISQRGGASDHAKESLAGPPVRVVSGIVVLASGDRECAVWVQYVQRKRGKPERYARCAGWLAPLRFDDELHVERKSTARRLGEQSEGHPGRTTTRFLW